MRDKKKWRARLGLIVQAVVTVSLFAALGFLVDWGEALRRLPSARPEWLVAAAACIVCSRLAITGRWLMILRAARHDGRFWSLFRVVSAGVGLGSLLPTSLGPDIARGVLLKTRSGDGKAASTSLVVSSLALDRYAATVGTLAVALVGAVAMGEMALAAVLVAVLAGIAAVTALLFSNAGGLIRVLTPGPISRIRPKLEALVAIMRTPGMFHRGMLPAILISMGMTLCRVGIFLCLYRAFGHGVPVGLALYAIPLMLIALMVPVSIGGFGVREWLLVIGFERAGVPPEISVSVGVLSFALQIVVSLPAIVQTLGARSLTTASPTSGSAQPK